MLIAVAVAGGWFLGRGKVGSSGTGNERSVSFYQSPMHPWIKSDKPGNCTICGMKLTPVYEGEKGFDTGANMVTLNSNAINVVNVQSEPVTQRPLERTLEVAGRIEADQTRSRILSAYVDGRIEKLFVNFAGAEVKEGEPLAVIYSPALLTAEREFLSILSQTNLAGSARLASEHERLVEGARQRLKRLGLTDEQIARARTGGAGTNFTTQIVAPISGTVVKREVFEGQYVKEGDRLFELIDLSRLWFVFEVYEQDLPAIKIGQTVWLSSPAIPGKKFEGPITFIEPTINEATRSARVRVEVENPIIDEKRQLFNGLYATGLIQFKSEPVLAVSRTAVIEPGDRPRVFVDHGAGAYEHRFVQLGRRGESFVEILDGLGTGELVVTSGGLLLDSQAQLNQVGTSPAAHQHDEQDHESAHQHAAELVEVKDATELGPFFNAVHHLSQALANDDVKTYNERLADLPIPGDPRLAEAATKLKANTKTALDTARTEYLPFSMLVVEVARSLRQKGQGTGLKIYKCPMFPRPGKNALWVQLDGPLRNPFYGSEMLECGTEVK
jgi:Cu(I)/Ag(I) efflux system membrane fusion protein